MRPFPKVAPRITNRGSRKGRSRILTETPEKERLEIELKERAAKASKPMPKKKIFEPTFSEYKKNTVFKSRPTESYSDGEDGMEEIVSLHGSQNVKNCKTSSIKLF